MSATLTGASWKESKLGRFFAPAVADLRHRPPGQVPALDVLRTFAVLVVVWGHTSVGYHKAGGADSVLSKIRILGAGWIGVDLFFVLSGYLIGKQLWRELSRKGTIDFWRFFLRRGFRIWPLYFFFLAFVTLVLGRGDFFGDKGWSDALFLTNYLNHGVVVGSWSLCTEEQFYLIAPLALMASAPFVSSVARYRRYLWLGLLALPAIRALIWWRLTGDLSNHDPGLWGAHVYQPIHSNCDGLLMGLILANLETQRQGTPARWSSRVAISLLGLSCVAALVLRYAQREVFNLTGMTLVLGSLVWVALHSQGLLPKILSARVFYVLSRLSYGMYLNHAYIHDPVVRVALSYIPGAAKAPSLHLLVTELIVIAIAAFLASVAFSCIEHPFLRLRDSLFARSESNRPLPVASTEQAEVVQPPVAAAFDCPS